MKGGFGLATTAFFGTGLAACGGGQDIAVASPAPLVPPKSLQLNYGATSKSLADALTVPAGYTATVLYRLGTPIAASPVAFKNDGADSARHIRNVPARPIAACYA